MTAPTVGDRAPQITLALADGPAALHELLRDGPLALLFFTEANTPTCDAQVRAFATEYDLIRDLGARVVAISTDTAADQARFAQTLAAPFPIVSDPTGEAARAFGVFDDHSRRSARAVFVIDADGIVRSAQPWYNPANSAQLSEVFGALGLET